MLHWEWNGRRSQLPRGCYYGVAIGGKSRHGSAVVDGYRVFPGSPLLLPGSSNAAPTIELEGFHPGGAHIVAATKPEEVPLLLARRAPFYELHFNDDEPANVDLTVPFHGRMRLNVEFRFSAIGGSLSVSTKARSYFSDGTARTSAALNTYAAAAFSANVLKLIEETERCDEMIISMTDINAAIYEIKVWAYDEAGG
jgi:hypothetical protein